MLLIKLAGVVLSVHFLLLTEKTTPLLTTLVCTESSFFFAPLFVVKKTLKLVVLVAVRQLLC